MAVVGGAVVGNEALTNAAINQTGVDGHASGTISAGTSGNLGGLTTTVKGDYIVVSVVSSTECSLVSDTTVLSWFERVDVHNPNGLGAGIPLHHKVWVAFSSGTLVGDVITVSLAASGNAAIVAVAVKNTYPLVPYDPYAVSVNWQTSATAVTDTIATGDPTVIVLGMFGWAGGSTASFTAGAGYTAIASVDQSTNIGCGIEYQILNAAQTALVVNATLGAAETSTQISDAFMANGENIYTIQMPTNQEGTIHNIYYNNSAGLPGHSGLIIAKADQQGNSQPFYNPPANGAFMNLHIHITATTAVIVLINPSTTDQIMTSWDGLRTI